ncbi:MAG: FHA domain-containing protein [Myxococcota bacterium]
MWQLLLGGEVPIQGQKKSEIKTTMVFAHETIAMMKAERAERVEKLRSLLSEESAILPIRKAPNSVWEYVTVGRASTADIVLKDPAVSNVHAHLAMNVEDHPVSLKDLDSSNGTHVNREPLQPHVFHPLVSGDCVRFGQTVFYYLRSGFLEELLQGA